MYKIQLDRLHKPWLQPKHKATTAAVSYDCYLSCDTESVDLFLVPDGSDKISGNWSALWDVTGSWIVTGESVVSLLDLICNKKDLIVYNFLILRHEVQ